MKIINEELQTVKHYILENFSDPLPENKLSGFIAGRSKMIRSSIAILFLKANGIEISDDLYKIIAAGEIIHNASLMHDDVIDNAVTRRGETTFAKIFNPKISVLAGDYLVSTAIGKLLSINNSQIISIFQNCAGEMAKAEIKQYFLRNKKPDIDEFIEICRGKTASLFIAMLESCTLLSNIPIDNAKNFGEFFGIAFQIKNDLETADSDKKNGILTSKDIIGIENTLILLDNYKGKLKNILNNIPDNKYKRALEDLI